MTTETRGNFIGGEWREVADGGTDAVLDPATGDAIAEVASSTKADVDRAVEAAAAAFPEWAATTPGERATALWRLADRIEEDRDELVALESRNVGKPIAAVPEEIDFVIDNLRFFAGAARTAHAQAPGEYMAGYTSILRREPLGVVASIAPWNYPLMMAIWKIGPALAAGNTVVLKPSELTPLTALRLAELAADLLPAGGAQRRHRPGRQRRRGAVRPTPTSRSSRSPARSPPARRSCAPRPTRSSASTSSWAARRRW